MDFIDRFENKDLKEIYAWMYKRSLPIPPIWSLSQIGFIIHGKAAGFLYTTNSGIAQLDSFCTNPEISHEERMVAMEAIAMSLIEEAKRLGVAMVACSSKFDSITGLARQLGFTDSGVHTALARRL